MQIRSKDIKNGITKRKKYLEEVLEYCSSVSDSYPEGHLRIAEKKNGCQYYLRTEKSDEKGRYLKKDELKMVRQLAQKDYCKAVAKIASTEYKTLKKMEKIYVCSDLEEIYSKLNRNRQPLITPIMLPDDEYVRQWESVEYIGKDIKDMSTDFITEKGEKVRSKSELIIANTLYKMGIPYRYEYPIQLKGYYNGIAYPDFTVLNVRKRKEIVWEHLGKMGDEGYVEDALYRLDKYEQNGYRLGDDLIITMETVAVPLGVSSIKRTIENYLL